VTPQPNPQSSLGIGGLIIRPFGSDDFGWGVSMVQIRTLLGLLLNFGGFLKEPLKDLERTP